jgi:hypothetical protein
MKKLKQIFSLTLIFTLVVIIYGCNQSAEPSLYELKPKGATPVITSLSPASEGLAGVTDITINGSNFSNVKEDNLVFFGSIRATVIDAQATKLIVKAPALIKNDLDVKIAVNGVENFSNVVKYNLLEAVGVYYAFAKGVDDPMSLTVDKNENLYVSLLDKGIKKISSAGTLTDYAPKGGESFWTDLKMGPNNILYGARNVRALFTVSEGALGQTFAVLPTGLVLTTLDFDANGNIWTSGSGGSIYSVVVSSKVATAFAIDYVVSSLRVYNGYLYVAGAKDTEEAIYRYKINSNTSLGAQEKVFDIGAAYGLKKVTIGSITFAEDGDLIVGTNRTDAFLLIKNGNASTMYSGLCSPSVKSIGFGTKKNLFYVREYTEGTSIYHSIVRVDMQKLSAPYYGRN